ncbi:Protein of unknown function [Enhydrobacter aerosaccus]|uniref:DUF4243 domain-containing protein n=1 Tax=Enhydrobacter aerosaccus TaxID=225324 RepID=A0A1T4KGW3_9HYPH|nr:questin oxidase family protein [Enhydrobacter aerosaccus]SJZ41644.1 Protein of unknown function [Enhydrobacter aerosaccus]
MTMSRQEAINDALARLHDVGFTWGPDYAGHGPMVAEAISMLGHDEAVAGWVDSYKRRRRHKEPPPRYRAIDGSDDGSDMENWRSALGDPSRLSDWHDFFGRQLSETQWQDATKEWIPRLIDGLAGGLTHGLIRTAHAVRGMPADGQPTDLQIDELARGLAYWAATYRSPEDDGALETTMPRDAARPETSLVLSAWTAFNARLLLGHLDRKIVSVIQLVHTITSAAALRTLLPLLCSDVGWHACERVRRVGRNIAGLALGSAPSAPETLALQPSLPWEELAGRAVAHDDEHAVKLTEACLQEDFVRPDPIYRVLAGAIQHRLAA